MTNSTALGQRKTRGVLVAVTLRDWYCDNLKPGTLPPMVLVAVLAAFIAGAIGFSLGQRHAPQVLQTHAADTLVGFLRVINRRLPEHAPAVRGVAWETYRGDMRDRMQVQLDASPFPVEDEAPASS